MVLIDEEGTMLHGVINKAYIEKLRSFIQEGNVYLIKNVRVIPAAAKFRPVQNEMMINFSPTTNIEEIKDNEDIPKHGFNFSSMEELSQRVNIDTYLSDVIGVATHIGPIEETRTYLGLSRIRDIFLLIEDQEVKVRLWGDKADLIDVKSIGNVIIITSTTVRKFGRYSLSSNSATQVFINLDIPETMDVQNSICSKEKIIKELHVEENHLKGTLEEQMHYNRKTLEELNGILLDSSNQGRIFTVEAVINDVNTRYGWYYISCSENNCKKLLEKRIDYYYCTKCDRKAQPKPRYKIKLQISDSTASASCVLFEKEAQQLIHESAENMVASIGNESDELPKPIQEICGQTVIFQFRLTDYNFTSCRPDYTVSRLFFLDTSSSSMKSDSNETSKSKNFPKDGVTKPEPDEESRSVQIHDRNNDERCKNKSTSRRKLKRYEDSGEQRTMALDTPKDDEGNLKKIPKGVIIKKEPIEDIEDDIHKGSGDDEEEYKVIRRSTRIKRQYVVLDDDEDSEEKLNAPKKRESTAYHNGGGRNNL
ncbi:replication factor A protein 1-like isoform X3 [Triticum aestivum]|nr:replication factor A protein 1-like isoform X3 [Triticum aestivum]